MNPFAFLIHHSWGHDDKLQIESFFAGTKSRINMHIKHIETTKSLYQKQLKEALLTLEKSFEIPRIEANERYKKLIAENGDDELERYSAHDESGLLDIDNELSMRNYELHEKYEELSTIFFDASLIQACSLLEKELKDLCNLLQTETHQQIALEDFASRDYIGGCFKYLRLVIKLDMKKLDPYVNKIRDLQFLRNKLVHDRGEFLKTDEKNKENLKIVKSIINSSGGRLELIDEEKYQQIKITQASYILDYYYIFLDFFQITLYLVEEKLDYALLKEKLQRLISSTKRQAVFEVESFMPKGKNIEILTKISFSGRSMPKGIKLELKLTNRKKKSVFCSYRGPKNKILEELAKNLERHEYIPQNEFYDYLLVRSEFSMDLKFI